MHPNPGFRKANRQQNIDFARLRSFGTLALNAEYGPLLSHIPFVLAASGKMLEAHLMRSNPIASLLETGQDAVIAVAGPDSYVSPDWYRIDNQVPTWNYIAVHIRGTITRLPDLRLVEVLGRLSNQFEHRLAPKPVWAMDKVAPEKLEKMLKMLVPIQMEVTAMDGTWKLAQNKPDEARIAAANEMQEHGIGSQVTQLANLMKNPPC